MVVANSEWASFDQGEIVGRSPKSQHYQRKDASNLKGYSRPCVKHRTPDDGRLCFLFFFVSRFRFGVFVFLIFPDEDMFLETVDDDLIA